MSNAFKTILPGQPPYASDVDQFRQAFSGSIDIGTLQLFQPIATPSTPVVTVGSSGQLTGGYKYIVVDVTGWKQPDGALFVAGFSPSAPSSSVTLANQMANVPLAVGPTGTIARAVYRTAANGSTYSFVWFQADNATTSWQDNVADASLGTGMPTLNGVAIPATVPSSNTTGTTINGNFIGTLTGSASQLGGLPSTDYLRTDSGAGTQTVANVVVFDDGIKVDRSDPYVVLIAEDTGFAGEQIKLTHYGGEFQLQDIGTGAFVKTILGVNRSTGEMTSVKNTLDDGYGSMTVTSITASSGQLGSASGTWTPASGSLNVAAGTVINVAAVPSGAKMYFIGTNYGQVWGNTTSNGASWAFTTSSFSQYVNWGYVNGISSTSITGNAFALYDGAYDAAGYFQINSGYLQFVVVVSVTTSSNSASNIRWAVS